MLACTFLLTAHFSHWRQQIILIFVELEDIASLSLTELSYQSIPTSPDTSTTPVSHHYTTEYSTATQPIPSANSLGTCQPCNWSITTADLAWSLHDNNKIGQNRLAFCKKMTVSSCFFCRLLFSSFHIVMPTSRLRRDYLEKRGQTSDCRAYQGGGRRRSDSNENLHVYNHKFLAAACVRFTTRSA